MRRREFITLLGGAALWPVTARGQQSSPIPQVGLVSIGADPGDPVVFRPFLRADPQAGIYRRPELNPGPTLCRWT
jgi:hypothetical protein